MTADGDVMLRHPINPRLGLFVHVTGELFTVDGTVPDRGTQTGGAVEAGFGSTAAPARWSFSPASNDALDADPIDRETHDGASPGSGC